MKILLLTFSDNYDHQDITFSVFEELQSKCNVWLMCIKCPKAILNRAYHVKKVDCPIRPGINKNTFNLCTLAKTISWIKKQKFNIIFFESLHVWNLPIQLLCSNSHTITYQMVHDLIPHNGDKQAKFVKLMNKAVCRLSNKIILCNKKYIGTAIKDYKIPNDCVSYMDLWRRFPTYSKPKFTKHILFFGRINPYKGINNLLDIVRKCPEFWFDVIGRVDNQMEAVVSQLKKETNVLMYNDYVSEEDMQNAFDNADLIILPYNSATQSGVIIDAYRYSRPVIAFNVGAIAEQIENKYSGFLIPNGDIDSFVDAIKTTMLLKHEKFEQLCINAYNYGLSKYGVSRAANQFMRLVVNT